MKRLNMDASGREKTLNAEHSFMTYPLNKADDSGKDNCCYNLGLLATYNLSGIYVCILNKINCYASQLHRRRTAPFKLESPSWWHHHIAILHLVAGVPWSVCPPRGLSLTLDRAQRSRGRRIILEMMSQAAASAPRALRLACQCWPCQAFR
jgi:hypothetical protein